MTVIKAYRSGGRIFGFSCQGHSGWADAGEDIVCAAVTSAVRLAECTINDVLKAGAEVSVDEQTAAITLKLPQGRNKPAEAVLEGFFLYMRELSLENPDHISMMEV